MQHLKQLLGAKVDGKLSIKVYVVTCTLRTLSIIDNVVHIYILFLFWLKFTF